MAAASFDSTSDTLFVRGAITETPTIGEFERGLAWQRAKIQLRTLRSLPPNWDDAGAPPIRGAMVDFVLEVLNSLEESGFDAPSRIVPIPTESIVVEWHSSASYVELEVDEIGRLDWLVEGENGSITQHSEQVGVRRSWTLDDEPAATREPDPTSSVSPA